MTDGAAIASAYVNLRITMPGIQKDIYNALGGSAVESAVSSRGKHIGQVIAGAVGGGVAAVTSKAISMVMGSIDGAVKRVDTMNNFPKVMKNLGYSTTDARKSIAQLSDGLMGLPTSLNSITSNVQRIAPSFSSLDGATKTALALNNALLAGGSPLENQAAAFEQYSQAVGKGKFEMEEWRSLQVAMPGQLRQIAQSLLGASGSTNDLYAAMKSGTISMDTFNDALVNLNVKGTGEFASFEQQARDATDGISTGWANLQTAITRGLANVIQKIKPFIDEMLKVTTVFVNALGPVIMQTIDMALAVVNWTAANKDWLGPIALIVGSLTAYAKIVSVVQGAKIAYAAAATGAKIATNAGTLASKLGGAAYAFQNSSIVRLMASLRANEALTLRSKAAILASAVATNTATVATKAWSMAMKTFGGPIGLIITAVMAVVGALVYFFTQTETGKKIWGEFTRFLGEAWANVSSFFVTVYEDYLKPVFDGIATVATWVFENILRPLFLGAQIYFAILGGIFAGIWEYILKPTFEALGAIFNWIYETIIVPIIDGIVLYVKIWAAIFTWLWENAIKPAFDAIGAIFTWIWENVISPVVGWIVDKVKLFGLGMQILWTTYVKPVFDKIGEIFNWIWVNIISPVVTWIQDKLTILGLGFQIMWGVVRDVWDNISGKIKAGWDVIKGIIDTLVRVIQNDPKKAFELARDAIGKAWEGIQDLAKKPVRFVIETVINGLIGTINKIPGVNIPKVPLPAGFARGGILPGMSRMSDGDDQLIMARRGEGMMVSEALRTSADRSAFLAANAAGRRGVGFASMLQGLAKGGLVHPMPGAVVTEEYGGYPGHRGIDLAKPKGTPILAAASGAVDFSGWYGGGGWMAGINHGGNLGTRYKHMMSPPIVGVGQMVKQKQVIGYEGSTGDSTGPHLHYEVLVGGNRVNPRPYLDGVGDAGILDLFGGLKDLLKGQFSKAFPGSDMWIDAAWGLAGQGIDSAINWGKSMLPWGGGSSLLYDNGGWLDPGTHLVENRSGRPEPILTATQWDALLETRGTGLEPGTRLALVLEDGTELGAYVEERAAGVVQGAFRSGTTGALTSQFGSRRR